jgi:hypothetical protein
MTLGLSADWRSLALTPDHGHYPAMSRSLREGRLGAAGDRPIFVNEPASLAPRRNSGPSSLWVPCAGLDDRTAPSI